MAQATATSMARLRQNALANENKFNIPQVHVGFDTVSGFEALQRMARMFATSGMVPKRYQGEEKLGQCAIALDMALRMDASPLMVMQNLYFVHEQPAWSDCCRYTYEELREVCIYLASKALSLERGNKNLRQEINNKKELIAKLQRK